MNSIFYNKKLPENSLAAFCFSTINFSDTYSAEIFSSKKIAVDQVLKSFISSAPNWVSRLLLCRNKIVKIFGINIPNLKNKEEQLKNFKSTIGNKLGVFEVFNKVENEILVGENNTHLDYRVSLLINEIHKHKYEIVISTIVKYNNSFGKIYFFFVKPFHKIIVPVMMRNMRTHLESQNGTLDN